MFGLPRTYERPRNVRLDTLIRLRWLAVCGQVAAVLVVHFGLEFEVPIWACLAVIALAALLNVALRVSFHQTQWLEPDRAAWLLAFDIAELAALLYLTGGLENPFSFLLLGPVLDLGYGAAAAHDFADRHVRDVLRHRCWCSCITTCRGKAKIRWSFRKSTWSESGSRSCSRSAISASIRGRSPKKRGSFRTRLAATELVLAREQHLSQLDGLAAAAAHELGTPLSTITVVIREIERALETNSPYAEDVKLLREQAQRCREILAKITELPTAEPFDRTPLSALIEEAVAPHRNFGVSIGVTLPPNRAAEPVGARNPAIRYGLGNLIENAVDFAHSRVEIFAQWTAEEVSIIISDDGPGFAPEVVDRIGAPYVTHRRPGSRGPEVEEDAVFGLGLGFFIAKTLLERSGARLSLINQAPPLHGATVTVAWSRADFERPVASPPLERGRLLSASVADC